MATIEKPKAFEAPGQPGSPVELRDRYDNFIGGAWVAPSEGRYRENLTPATGRPFSSIADSTAADIELALDAAHAAKGAWAGNRLVDVLEPALGAQVLDGSAPEPRLVFEMQGVITAGAGSTTATAKV